MSDINLDKWASYLFQGDDKIFRLGRLCGYTYDGSTDRFHFIVTEPVTRVEPVDKVVVTTDNKQYKLYDPIEDGTGQKMDMMYAISKWSDQNQKSSNRETTKDVIEQLAKGIEEA